MLRLRGVALSSEDEARILASTDTAQIERWADRALVVTHAGDLFDEPTPSTHRWPTEVPTASVRAAAVN